VQILSRLQQFNGSIRQTADLRGSRSSKTLEFSLNNVESRDLHWTVDEVSQFLIDVSSLLKHQQKEARVQ
jgi:hypothetical protein